MEFKDRLKKYRTDNNLTQEELASKLCVSRQAISKYETGLNYPNLAVMTDISKMLGVSLDELLSREEIAKETIKSNVDRRKNKRNLILSAIAVALVLVISVTAMILALCLPTSSSDNGLCLVGMVGSLTEEKPDINALESGKLFGYCLTQKDGMTVGKSYNTFGGYIKISRNEFFGNNGEKDIPANSKQHFSPDVQIVSACDVDLGVTVSSAVTECKLYAVYYDRVNDKYVFEFHLTASTNSSVSIEMEDHGARWRFAFSFKRVDNVKEITVYEYGMNGVLLHSLKLGDQRAFTLSKDCLYVVVEEKFADASGNEYFNRDVVLNSEVDRFLYYFLPILNECGYATQTLKLEK